MNGEDEQDEEEAGSQEVDMQRRIKDSRKLEDLMMEIEVMGDILDKLEEVPRKDRDPIWRGKRNDVRMILINAGDMIERGCYHDTQRHKVRGEWKALKNERREDREFAVVARIERVELWYLKAQKIRDETKQDWIIRMVKELSGTVANIARAVNIDDAKDRKKAKKLRRESDKGKKKEEHKKRQKKRFDEIASKQKAKEKAIERLRKRAEREVEKTAKEEAGRLVALEDLRRKEREVFEKAKKSETPKEMKEGTKELEKVHAQIKKIESQQKVEKEVSGGKGKSAVSSKVITTVRIIVIHQKPVDLEIHKKVIQNLESVERRGRDRGQEDMDAVGRTGEGKKGGVSLQGKHGTGRHARQTGVAEGVGGVEGGWVVR